MDQELWKKVLDFNLDAPLSQYGFSTRLENENFWTTGFAQGAIIEYKKFMYLAATSGTMVSPSEIVDIVWHQHLIFTVLYEEFSDLLGSKIEHVPSTHQNTDFEKFKQAKERTSKLYQENFGTQPAEFWEYDDMYGPLQLEGMGYTITGVIGVGSMLLLALIIVSPFILRPLYVNINNPGFLTGYVFIVAVCGLILSYYNRVKLLAIVKSWDKSAFIFNLSALELVYLSKKNINAVINGVVNSLFLDGKLTISQDGLLNVEQPAEANNVLELSVIQTILAYPDKKYIEIQQRLALKPAFNKTARALDGFNDYIMQSAPFIKLFIINFIVLSILFVFGAARLIIGIQRGRPIEFILVVMGICFFLMTGYLRYLTKAIGSIILPAYYKDNILPTKPERDDWDWQYFVLDSAVIAAAFYPLTQTSGNNGGGDSGGGGCGSGGGGGCGGGGCGGCGGGD